jgi:hypothetical protein
MSTRKTTVVAWACLVAATTFAHADDASQPIRFADDAATMTVTGHIAGKEVDAYTLQAKKGQKLHAKLTSESTWVYFDVLPPGGREPLFIGARIGDEFTSALPADGEYTLNVHLSGYGAMKGEQADYSVAVSLD